MGVTVSYLPVVPDPPIDYCLMRYQSTGSYFSVNPMPLHVM